MGWNLSRRLSRGVGYAATDQRGFHAAGQFVAAEGSVLPLAGQRGWLHHPMGGGVKHADVGRTACCESACAGGKGAQCAAKYLS